LSDVAVLQPPKPEPTQDAVVFITSGLVGSHVGLSYIAHDDGTRARLELAWHLQLRHDEGAGTEAWVQPAIDEFALSNVRMSAGLIASKRRDGSVPYAFARNDAHYREDGTLQLGASLGLTCATFVLLVFEHARVPLIDEASWGQPRTERTTQDTAAQEELVAAMRRDPRFQDHASSLSAQVGSIRIRAEEVAAASGLDAHPIAFARAAPAGASLLEEMGELADS